MVLLIDYHLDLLLKFLSIEIFDLDIIDLNKTVNYYYFWFEFECDCYFFVMKIKILKFEVVEIDFYLN